MSINRYRPHILILPEDRANHDLAQGFELHLSVNEQVIQTLNVAGGWTFVLDCFLSRHVPDMNLYSSMFMVLLIDFDDQVDHRMQHFNERIPEHLRERVFVIGSRNKPERLRAALGATFENIGLELAEECSENRYQKWNHDLLRHNQVELARLREHVHPILFSY